MSPADDGDPAGIIAGPPGVDTGPGGVPAPGGFAPRRRTLRDYGSWPAVLGLLGAALAAAFVASSVVVPFFLLSLTGSSVSVRADILNDPWLFFVFILIEDLAFVLVVYVALVRTKVTSARDMGLTHVAAGSVLRGLGWGLLFILVSETLTILLRGLGLGQTQSAQFPVENAGLAGRIAVVIAGCVLAPVAEEIFFRGFVFRAMKARKGLARALIYSSALFGLIHLNLAAFLPIGVGAVILALAYERSGDLWTAIVAHATNNIFAFALLFLSLRG